jgi:2-oxoisovalerate dehydrogenase E1 component
VSENLLGDKTIPVETLLKIYKTAITARFFDEKAELLYKQNKCYFQIGCRGHEIIGSAASVVFKSGLDWFYPYYREHALVLGLGMSLRDFARNILSKDADPNSGGRQMPMHWGSKSLRIVSQSSPTGSQFLPAVGTALGLKKQNNKSQSVVYVSAGEGACAQGEFYEALNWACKDKLPVVFVIHNNLWAISVTFRELFNAPSISQAFSGFNNLRIFSLEGKDIDNLLTSLESARQTALSKGPALVEVFVPRLCSHSISDDHKKYRSKEELEESEKNDPIKFLESVLHQRLYSFDPDLIKLEIKDAINKVTEEAESEDPNPSSSEVFDGFLFLDRGFEFSSSDEAAGEEHVMIDAINLALKRSMRENEKILVFGEDVAGAKGGVFGATRDLTHLFSEDRCFNSPLAEASIIGVALGLAQVGFKPVIEIQFGDYIWTAMNQIRNEVATLSYRSNGDYLAPMVIRVPVGGYIRGAFYHSQNIEATFCHFPALVTVFPSNASDAYGLLLSAIETSNPVLFLEHKGLYRSPYAKGTLGGRVALGKARIVKVGKDLTAISYGYVLHLLIRAAKKLEEEENRSIEIIDLRTLWPLDKETIVNSVKKTSRVVIAYEDNLFLGYGTEVAAMIAEECFEYLDAPIVRVAGLNVPGVCQAPELEKAILPDETRIYFALKRVLNF